MGQRGLEWTNSSKSRANEVERTPTTYDIFYFNGPATWTRKARHGMNLHEHWQGPKKRARVNNLVKWRPWVAGGSNIQSKQARILRDWNWSKNWNWSVKHFILRARFSKILLFKMILIRLKSHQFYGVARTFSYTQAWVSQEGAEIWRQKRFLSFEW